MAKKPHTQSQAAGEPQGYVYPGTLAGRKFVFEELTIRAMRQLQSLNGREDAEGRGATMIDMVLDLLASPKVRVTSGEPFTKENVDELGVKDVRAALRFFLNPKLTLEELTADDQVEDEGDDPNAE